MLVWIVMWISIYSLLRILSLILLMVTLPLPLLRDPSRSHTTSRHHHQLSSNMITTIGTWRYVSQAQSSDSKASRHSLGLDEVGIWKKMINSLNWVDIWRRSHLSDYWRIKSSKIRSCSSLCLRMDLRTLLMCFEEMLIWPCFKSLFQIIYSNIYSNLSQTIQSNKMW